MKKYFEIAKLHGFWEGHKYNFPELNVALNALYISAKGTKHFYEALELCAAILPEVYKEEFEKLKLTNQYIE